MVELMTIIESIVVRPRFDIRHWAIGFFVFGFWHINSKRRWMMDLYLVPMTEIKIIVRFR